MFNFLICVQFVCAFYKILTSASLSTESFRNARPMAKRLNFEKRICKFKKESEVLLQATQLVARIHIPGTKQKSKAIAKPSNSQRPKGPKK